MTKKETNNWRERKKNHTLSTPKKVMLWFHLSAITKNKLEIRKTFIRQLKSKKLNYLRFLKAKSVELNSWKTRYFKSSIAPTDNLITSLNPVVSSTKPTLPCLPKTTSFLIKLIPVLSLTKKLSIMNKNTTHKQPSSWKKCPTLTLKSNKIPQQISSNRISQKSSKTLKIKPQRKINQIMNYKKSKLEMWKCLNYPKHLISLMIKIS